MRKSRFHSVCEKAITSWIRACSMKQRFSSIHVLKSAIPLACLVNKCAGLFPYRLTWENSTHLKSQHSAFTPTIMGSTEDGGLDISQSAL